jgi:hypothetical protein
LRDKLYRVALSQKNVQQLQQTALHYPEFCKWTLPEKKKDISGGTSSLGSVELTNGYKLIR